MEHYPNFLPKKYLSRNHYGRTHLEINVKSTYQHDDRRDGLHEVGNGRLVGAYFLRGLGEAGGPLLEAIASPADTARVSTAIVDLR